MLTLAAVVLGGIISILSRLALDVMRQKTQRRTRKADSQAAVRVIRFHFYAAQYVLKESLETGQWWSGAAGLDVAAAGEDLRTLADLLPDEEWRIYTAAWRRLRSCIRRCDTARAQEISDPNATLDERLSGQNATSQRISPVDLQFLLATFVTVDDARRRLQLHCVDVLSGDILLGQIPLTNHEKVAALSLAGQAIDRSRWQEILQPSERAA